MRFFAYAQRIHSGLKYCSIDQFTRRVDHPFCEP